MRGWSSWARPPPGWRRSPRSEQGRRREMPRPNSGDDDADGDAEDESPRPAAARDSQSSGRANMPDPLEPALPAPAYPAADYAFTGERPLSLPSMPSDRLAAPAALEQPPPAAAADVEPPAKRRRGRPRSVVFNYFVREQEPGGGLVNRCIFCNFKSRDKSQNPTYLARHCITACRAPPEVVDLLQQSRASSSHSARQASGPAAYDDAGASPAPSAPPTVAVEQPTGASYSPNYRPDARLVGPSPGAADFQAGRRMAPASASSPPAMPRRRDHWLGNQNQLLPVPAPSVLLTPPSALMSPVEPALHDAGVSPLFPRRLGAASPHEPLERPGQRSTLSAVSLPQRPYSSEMFQSQPQQHQPPPPPPQEHVRQQQPAPQQQGQPQTQQLQQVRPLSEPHELRRQPQHGTTGGTPLLQQPLAFQPVGVPYYEEPPSQRGPRSQARNEEGLSQLQQPRLGPPHAGRHGKLPALPSFSHVQLDRSRRQADASPAPGYTSGLRPDLIASTLPAYPSLDDERRRLTDRCTAAVHSMLTDAVTSTLICLGAAQSRNLRTVGQEVDPLEGATGGESGPAGALPVQTLRAGAYDGVCSAMAIDTHGTLVYLGAEDCMLPSQLTSFVSSCTGKHLEEGSFCAILFACDPWDPAVAAFADVQSRCQNLFLVLDVARAADEICGRIVRASASAAKCADQTLCIARFLATNDVMPVSDELDAIQNLPNATRFSAVAPAMLQLAANRQKVADALSAFQPDAGPASRHSGGGGGGASRFASYGVELLSSDSFVQALFNTAKFLEVSSPAYRPLDSTCPPGVEQTRPNSDARHSPFPSLSRSTMTGSERPPEGFTWCLETARTPHKLWTCFRRQSTRSPRTRRSPAWLPPASSDSGSQLLEPVSSPEMRHCSRRTSIRFMRRRPKVQ
jgi:hypothetical protein